MASHLEALVALQQTLDELSRAQASLNGVPEWMSALHAEHSLQKAEIDEATALGEQADQERRKADVDLADAQEKLKHFQEQIGRVTTQREYGALLKEIDTVKEHINELEQQGIEALERAEVSQQKQAELTEAFRDLDQRYQAELEKWESEKPSFARTVEELSKRAEQLREKVARGVLVLFDRIYERFEGDALAQVMRIKGVRGANALWHCSACSYSVRPQIVVEIRNEGSLNQCESCKRILFWKDTADE